MLNESLLSIYIKQFKELVVNKDFTGKIGLSIATKLSDTLNHKSVDLSELYLDLDDNYLSPPQVCHVTKKNIKSHLLLNDFISTIIAHRSDNTTQKKLTAIIDSSARYKKNALLPGIKKYNNQLLLINNQKQRKRDLLTLLKTLKELTEDDINLYRKNTIKENLSNKIKNHSLPYTLLGKEGTEQAKKFLADNLSQIPINDNFIFLKDLENIINKPNLTYQEIASLKLASKQFERSVLMLPSIKKVTQFHWLINAICNILNLFIHCIESQKSKEVKAQLFHFKPWIEISENEINKIKHQIRH